MSGTTQGFGSDDFTAPPSEDVVAYEYFLPFMLQSSAYAISAWFLNPLTVTSYRWSVTNQKTLPKELLWDVFKKERSSHPGKWVGTTLSQGFWEALAYMVGEYATLHFIYKYDPSLYVEDPLPNEDWDPLDPEPNFAWTSHGFYGAAVRLFAGFIGAVVSRPFGLARARVGTQLPLPNGKYKYTGCISAIMNIYKSEGITPFVKGFVPNAISAILQDVIRTYLLRERNFFMKQITRYLPTNNRHILALEHAFCCVIDGVLLPILSLSITRPFDIISRRMDLQGSGMEVALGMSSVRHSSWIACGKAIFAEEGIFGFYKGIGLEILRDTALLSVVIFASDLFLNYKGYFRRVKTHTEWSSF